MKYIKLNNKLLEKIILQEYNSILSEELSHGELIRLLYADRTTVVQKAYILKKLVLSPYARAHFWKKMMIKLIKKGEKGEKDKSLFIRLQRRMKHAIRQMEDKKSAKSLTNLHKKLIKQWEQLKKPSDKEESLPRSGLDTQSSQEKVQKKIKIKRKQCKKKRKKNKKQCCAGQILKNGKCVWLCGNDNHCLESETCNNGKCEPKNKTEKAPSKKAKKAKKTKEAPKKAKKAKTTPEKAGTSELDAYGNKKTPLKKAPTAEKSPEPRKVATPKVSPVDITRMARGKKPLDPQLHTMGSWRHGYWKPTQPGLIRLVKDQQEEWGYR